MSKLWVDCDETSVQYWILARRYYPALAFVSWSLHSWLNRISKSVELANQLKPGRLVWLLVSPSLKSFFPSGGNLPPPPWYLSGSREEVSEKWMERWGKMKKHLRGASWPEAGALQQSKQQQPRRVRAAEQQQQRRREWWVEEDGGQRQPWHQTFNQVPVHVQYAPTVDDYKSPWRRL